MSEPSAARSDPEWYTPRLPQELEVLDGSVQGGLAVGAPGKVGLLELSLTRAVSVTRIARQYQRVPLHVYRPVYLDDELPDMAFIFVQQFGDGIVQGDRYRIDISCGARSRTHVTTQTYANIFGARHSVATQLVNLHVERGAVLEYLPAPVVPFRHSRLFQRTCLTIDPEATVILGETLLPGRVAHGEAHAYDVYWTETEARRPDGELLFADVLRLVPSTAGDPTSFGILHGHDVIGGLYIISGPTDAARVVALLRQTPAPHGSEVLIGVTELPNGAGAFTRVLGHTSKEVQATLRALWHTARRELLGAGAPNLRLG